MHSSLIFFFGATIGILLGWHAYFADPTEHPVLAGINRPFAKNQSSENVAKIFSLFSTPETIDEPGSPQKILASDDIFIKGTIKSFDLLSKTLIVTYESRYVRGETHTARTVVDSKTTIIQESEGSAIVETGLKDFPDHFSTPFKRKVDLTFLVPGEKISILGSPEAEGTIRAQFVKIWATQL